MNVIGDLLMNTCFFRITIVATLGALVARLLHLGIIEIATVFVIANLAYMGYCRYMQTRAVVT